MKPVNNLLVSGAAQLGLSINDDFFDKIEAYLDLLGKWSKAYNLTAITERDEQIVKHILDSLAIAPYLEGQRFIDVGTGAGLPGIPLALAYPEQSWVLLDSLEKRTRFLTQVKNTLKLENIEIQHARVEDYRPEVLFHGAVSRAFSSLASFAHCVQPLLNDSGAFYAMKGQLSEEELNELSSHWKIACHYLEVPYLDQARCLVVGKHSC